MSLTLQAALDAFSKGFLMPDKTTKVYGIEAVMRQYIKNTSGVWGGRHHGGIAEEIIRIFETAPSGDTGSLSDTDLDALKQKMAISTLVAYMTENLGGSVLCPGPFGRVIGGEIVIGDIESALKLASDPSTSGSAAAMAGASSGGSGAAASAAGAGAVSAVAVPVDQVTLFDCPVVFSQNGHRYPVLAHKASGYEYMSYRDDMGILQRIGQSGLKFVIPICRLIDRLVWHYGRGESSAHAFFKELIGDHLWSVTTMAMRRLAPHQIPNELGNHPIKRSGSFMAAIMAILVTGGAHQESVLNQLSTKFRFVSFAEPAAKKGAPGNYHLVDLGEVPGQMHYCIFDTELTKAPVEHEPVRYITATAAATLAAITLRQRQLSVNSARASTRAGTYAAAAAAGVVGGGVGAGGGGGSTPPADSRDVWAAAAARTPVPPGGE